MSSQLVRFFIVGIGCAALFFLVNYSALRATGTVWIALVIAYAVCVPIGYLLQRNFTFRDREQMHGHATTASRYVLLQLSGALFVYGASELLNSLVPHYPILVSLGTTGLVSCVGFIISRGWVFANAPACAQNVKSGNLVS